MREDGREGDVFSLIGPKRFDAPWKEIEAQGFISPASCYEMRIDLPQSERLGAPKLTGATPVDERERLYQAFRVGDEKLLVVSKVANFYTLAARDTVDQDFAQNRQRFLAEQGYSYTILDSQNLAA